MSAPSMGVLHGEHVLLGASFHDSGTNAPLGVSEYAREKCPDWPGDGASLTDLTGSTYLLVSGEAASSFASVSLAGKTLGVGEGSFEAVLSGSGELLSVPLALRCGDSEFVIVDPSERGAALEGWLGFLRSAGEGDSAPFASVSVEDASMMLVPLLLAGGAAPAVLGDYLHDGDRLPEPGAVRQLRLDSFVCIVSGVPLPGDVPAYLALVPVAAARPIWRSLLSFTEVSPVGIHALRRRLGETLPWGGALESTGPARVAREELEGWGILRPGSDFIGARGL